METIGRRGFLRNGFLAGGAVVVGSPDKKPTPEPYHSVIIPNTRGELAFTRSLHQGDMLFVRTQRIWLMHDSSNLYEQSGSSSIVLAAIRARTEIKALSYTTYPGLPVNELLVAAKSQQEVEQQQEFIDLITKQLMELRTAGVLERDCIQGCNSIRLVGFIARDVAQPSGIPILELRRIRNQRNLQ